MLCDLRTYVSTFQARGFILADLPASFRRRACSALVRRPLLHIEYRIAPSAFINAELLRVTAPIAGRLTQDLPRKGQFIARPEKVTLIDSMAPDRRHLLDIERQYAASKENSELARKQLDEAWRWTLNWPSALRRFAQQWSAG